MKLSYGLLSLLPSSFFATQPLWLGQAIPEARGNFKYDAATDSVKLYWPANHPITQQTLEAAKYTHALLDWKNTNDTYHPKTTARNFQTVHPLGGAVIGKACDFYGRVKGYKGLYVVDGALIPGATGCVASSLTIAAMAERCMDQIIHMDVKVIRNWEPADKHF